MPATTTHRDLRAIAILGVALTLVGLLSVAGGVVAAVADTADTGTVSLETAPLPSSAFAAVGDRVWSDVDHDGVQDAGEPGVEGVTATLLDATGTAVTVDGDGDPVTPITTDAAGLYRFDRLTPGSYLIEFTTIPGTQLTYQGSVAGDGTDSDVDPTTGQAGPVDLAAAEDDTTVDAGLWTPAPSLSIEKRAQGSDADTPPGPAVATGSIVTFDYLVTNTGNEPLEDLVVDDDQGVVVACPQTTIGRAETVACTGTDTAVSGAYTNTGTASAGGADSGVDAAPASDVAHYTGVEPLLSLEKQVNGADADTAAEPLDIDLGDPVTFAFRVDNTGTETVEHITLTDGMVAMTCPATSLDPGTGMDCTPLEGTAVAGLHTNVATVDGTGVDTGAAAGDTDSASYFGHDRRVSFLKEVLDPVSGQYRDGDADAGTPGSNDGVAATIASGLDAQFRFRLENTGNEALAPVSVDDPHCDSAPALLSGDAGTTGTLDVGETWLLACSRASVTSSFTNDATVDAGGLRVGERARVEVATGAAAVALDKTVRDPATGSYGDTTDLAPGAEATFRLRVTNVGQRALHDLVVTDPHVPACDRSFAGPLAPGQSETWTCGRPAVTTGFVNAAAVSAQPAGGGATVTDEDTATVRLVAPTAPDMTLTKTLLDQDATLVTWALVVENHGPGDVPGPITVEDRLPEGLAFVSGDGGGFACQGSAAGATCTRAASLEAGDRARITLVTRIQSGTTGDLTNTATVRSAGADRNPTDNTGAAVVDLGDGPGDPDDPGGPRGAPGGPLPATGASVVPLVVAGLGAVTAGLLLLWGARRRRSLIHEEVPST